MTRQIVDAARPQQMKPRLAVAADIDVARIQIKNQPTVWSHLNKRIGLHGQAPLTHPVRLFVLVGLSYISVGTACATTIVIHRSPTAITVGADSKVFRDNRSPAEITCKIHPCGRFFVAESGFVQGEGFRSSDARNFACQATSSIDRIAADLAYILKTNYGVSVERIAKQSEHVRLRIDQGRSVSEFALVGMVGSVPTVIVHHVFVKAGEATVRTDQCPSPICSDAFISFGTNSTVTALIDDPRETERPPLDLMNRLISAQANATPEMVGGPIDVLQIDSHGPCWCQAKPECQKESGIPLCPLPVPCLLPP